jgi:hypothetical protein
MQIAYTVRFREYDFAQQKGKEMGGHTCRVLVAGKEPEEGLAKGGAARPVVAARKERERGAKAWSVGGKTGRPEATVLFHRSAKGCSFEKRQN